MIIFRYGNLEIVRNRVTNSKTGILWLLTKKCLFSIRGILYRLYFWLKYVSSSHFYFFFGLIYFEWYKHIFFNIEKAILSENKQNPKYENLWGFVDLSICSYYKQITTNAKR